MTQQVMRLSPELLKQIKAAARVNPLIDDETSPMHASWKLGALHVLGLLERDFTVEGP